MGIVHHSNYLRFFEEARVMWAVQAGLIDYQKKDSAAHFAVLETHVQHKKPACFGDVLTTKLQVKAEGIKVIFEYALFKESDLLATAKTVHVPLNENLKPIKLPTEMKSALEKEKWTETWLLNL